MCSGSADSQLNPQECRPADTRPSFRASTRGEDLPRNRLRPDVAIVGNLVALRGRLRNRFKRQWNARPKALLRAAVIVMRDPFKERAFQVVLGKGIGKSRHFCGAVRDPSNGASAFR